MEILTVTSPKACPRCLWSDRAPIMRDAVDKGMPVFLVSSVRDKPSSYEICNRHTAYCIGKSGAMFWNVCSSANRVCVVFSIIYTIRHVMCRLCSVALFRRKDAPCKGEVIYMFALMDAVFKDRCPPQICGKFHMQGT